ncbi:MAG: 5-formyltetrahydrofolate cyclo-ligase [Pseudomonadota bacterium]
MPPTPPAAAPQALAARKAEARRAAFARRKAARAALGPAPQSATDALLALLAEDPAAIVAGYLPIRTEIDPRPAMTALHAAGRRLCVPVIRGDGRPLAFHAWTPEAELVPGPFGAPVPASAEPLTPQALITPLVAFDAGLLRLGYGGGFYDRTLAGLPGARAVGLAFSAQLSDAPLPREATDRPLDALATELGPRRAPAQAPPPAA